MSRNWGRASTVLDSHFKSAVGCKTCQVIYIPGKLSIGFSRLTTKTAETKFARLLAISRLDAVDGPPSPGASVPQSRMPAVPVGLALKRPASANEQRFVQMACDELHRHGRAEVAAQN